LDRINKINRILFRINNFSRFAGQAAETVKTQAPAVENYAQHRISGNVSACTTLYLFKTKRKNPENRACSVKSESHLTGIDPV
jgi:hypothetical protein